MVKNILVFVFYIALIILVIDFLGFMAWGLSGQFPADNFYIGSITRHALQMVLF